jgi:hypothetical protein
MRSPHKRWTEAADAELRQLAESGLNRIEIARRLNRSVAATEVRASALGIRISSATARAPSGSNVLGSRDAAPRLRKYVESLAYGKRTGRVAYVMDTIKMPSPAKGAEWTEDKKFNGASELLATPSLKAAFKTALEKGCALRIEK